MFKGHVAEGLVTGTGALIIIQTGWAPSYVKLVNPTGLVEGEWFSNMANGTMLKRITAGTLSLVGTNGISVYAGSPGANGAGFTIGTDTINTNAQPIYYIAYSTDA